ncbi:MAG: N-acetyltransferase family protein [Pseudomonadota bacterium]
MTIRAAEARDVPAICGHWNDVIRDTLISFKHEEMGEDDVTAYLAARAAAGHPFFVAELGGMVVGFATYFQFRGGSGYAHTLEHSIMLGAAARGQGLGRKLLISLEDHARSSGHHSLFAGVSSANPAGRAFHAAMGYEEITTLREVGFKWGRWLDLTLMQKIL